MVASGDEEVGLSSSAMKLEEDEGGTLAVAHVAD
jgi:hypothetical protein